MSVVVGITTRNRSDILPKAIQSALAQEYTPLQVSVFNDNSSDSTQRIRQDFPLIAWEMSTETKGLLFARNKLMREATSLYFCSLDDDAWFLSPKAITTAISYLENHRQVAAVAFDIVSPDFPDQRKINSPVETSLFIGCGHLLRLDAVREVGYYDAFPGSYGSEEKDLCLKLMDKGYQVMFLPGIHVWHDKTKIARDEKDQYVSSVCNDLVFMYRRSPLLILIPGLLFKILSHLKFSILYKKGILFRSGVKGILRFLGLIFTLQRNPVSLRAFRKYHMLSGKPDRNKEKSDGGKLVS